MRLVATERYSCAPYRSFVRLGGRLFSLMLVLVLKLRFFGVRGPTLMFDDEASGAFDFHHADAYDVLI